MSNSNDPSSTPSPVKSLFCLALQQISGKDQAHKTHELVKVINDLRVKLSDKKERAQVLETDLKLSERHREQNLNTALSLFANPGQAVLVERQNLIVEIVRLKGERDEAIKDHDKAFKEHHEATQEHDKQIRAQNEFIGALQFDLVNYASQDKWHLMYRSFLGLQQQYGRMPHDFEQLQLKYANLDDEHINVSNRLKTLEGDHTELKTQYSQIEDEKAQLEKDAETSKRNSEVAAAQHWALEVQCDQILEQKEESVKKAEALEDLLATLATQTLKRILLMAGVLEPVRIDPKNDDLKNLCLLAYEQLGLNEMDLAKNLEKARTHKDGDAAEERDESNLPGTHAGDNASSMSPSKDNIEKPTTESPNTFDARRRREVADAEEKLLGPLGLGFEDGSPTLKKRPILEGSKTPTVSPRKTLGARLGADDIDQVTPARTGGTCGIARDDWRIAGNDLEKLTEVFRGPRAPPIAIMSPGVRSKGAEKGTPLEEKHASQEDTEEAIFLGSNEDEKHEKDSAQETEVEGDVDTVKDGSIPASGKSTDIWGETSFGTGEQEQTPSKSQNALPAAPATALKPVSSTRFAAFKSSSKTPSKGSRLFHHREMNQKATVEKANAIPHPSNQSSFTPPQSQEFSFGTTSSGGGGVPFTAGSDTNNNNKSVAATNTPEQHAAAPNPFHLSSSASSPKSQPHSPNPSQQSFNFGNSVAGIAFTSSTQKPSAPAFGASPAAQGTFASGFIQTEEEEDEEASKQEAIPPQEEDEEASRQEANTTTTTTAQAAAAAAAAPPKHLPDGPNRKQRRAASRERKAKAQKLQTVAEEAERRRVKKKKKKAGKKAGGDRGAMPMVVVAASTG